VAFGRSISIGPEFFEKAKNDYSNWRWAIIREFFQNGIDAPGSREIVITIGRKGADTLLHVANDGAPMNEDTLVNKLLSLGASGKDGTTTTGGFGKAKEILYFAHKQYEITTGHLRVNGSGAGYDLETIDLGYPGTVSEVTLEGDLVDELTDLANEYIFMTQWRGVFVLNGKKVKGQFRKGSRRREFSWATVYTNRSFIDRLVVRINGIPMFRRHLNCGGKCVVLELKGSSLDVLQANRDSLSWGYSNQLESFIDEITVDKHSALAVQEPVYTHYEGDKLTTQAKVVKDLLAAAYATQPKEIIQNDEEAPIAGMPIQDLAACLDEQPKEAVRETRKGCIKHEFIVKNETGMEVPAHFQPHSFSAYSRKLLSIWMKCLLEVHDLFGKEATFSLGFIFHEDNEAEYERSPEYGTVFYVNPATVVQQQTTRSRSLSKRWKYNNEGRHLLLGAVVHEYVHSLGYAGHDESYAGKLTDTMAMVMANKKRFNPCFR